MFTVLTLTKFESQLIEIIDISSCLWNQLSIMTITERLYKTKIICLEINSVQTAKEILFLVLQA